jgi:hypothetical protein
MRRALAGARTLLSFCVNSEPQASRRGAAEVSATLLEVTLPSFGQALLEVNAPDVIHLSFLGRGLTSWAEEGCKQMYPPELHLTALVGVLDF